MYMYYYYYRVDLLTIIIVLVWRILLLSNSCTSESLFTSTTTKHLKTTTTTKLLSLQTKATKKVKQQQQQQEQEQHSTSSSSPIDDDALFWKHYQGQIYVNYGPDGHPFEQKQKQHYRSKIRLNQRIKNKHKQPVEKQQQQSQRFRPQDNESDNLTSGVAAATSTSTASETTSANHDIEKNYENEERSLLDSNSFLATSPPNASIGIQVGGDTDSGVVDDIDQKNVSYIPIRIGIVTDPIEALRNSTTNTTNSVYSNNIGPTIDYILDTVLPDAITIWSKHLYVYPVHEPIEIYPNDCIGRFLLDNGDSMIQYQTFNDTDLVLIVDGSFTSNDCTIRIDSALAYASVCATDQYGRPVIGFIHFCLASITILTESTMTSTTATATATTNSTSNVSSSTFGLGFNGTDGSSTSTTTTTAASGATTTTTSMQDDPDTLIELLQKSYGNYTNQTFNIKQTTISLEAVVLHEIAHAIGVIAPLFIYFTNIDTGVPFTTIDISSSTGSVTIPIIEKTCGNGTTSIGQYPDDNIILTEINTKNNLLYQYLVTPRVKQVSQNFFNCTSVPGARLEVSQYCIGSHWHERHMYTELMSPRISGIGENVLSSFTLALLEDTGWYNVDYIDSILPKFGINSGCDFLYNDCIDVVTEQVPEYVVSEFCSAPLLFSSVTEVSTISLDNNLYCDPSHESWVLCDLFAMPKDTTTTTTGTNTTRLEPLNRQYFTDIITTTGETIMIRPDSTIADSCPIPSVPLGLDCTKDDTVYTGFYPGEQVGTNSKCFNAYYTDTRTGTTTTTRRPACAKYTCDNITMSLIVHIGSSNTTVTCNYSEQVISILNTNTINAQYYIVCPRREAICPHFFTCPYACSGRGVCVPTNTGSTTGSSNNIIPPVKCICNDITNTDPACASPAIVAIRGPTPVWYSTPRSSTTPVPVPVPVPSIPTTIISQISLSPVGTSTDSTAPKMQVSVSNPTLTPAFQPSTISTPTSSSYSSVGMNNVFIVWCTGMLLHSLLASIKV